MVEAFSELQREFFEFVADIKYSTMTTVDSRGRPRSRVLVPIWQVIDGRPVGWIATYRTPVKTAHLARNPHVTTSYWSPAQNAVYVDSVASWVDDHEVKREVWELYRQGSPPPVGYDPQTYWKKGPSDPEYHVLRLDPWRVQVLRGRDLATGRPARVWRAEGAA
ncbi:pyridoxamine 5'-phosphate oxidase family protein [Streptosporangium roseum]|uniref:Pyridoxamine 5'-phosphate oxidase N-terminal domain-containing protein n=1 Tax=Streptosporangium roseum (strain ATCC 12428 / DSM 43021 / JCM 3005 / KCTC 9067 / NCIMB 10171 / NRRL 2505 / NI 9100) TaxID=479432 RepID=D2B0U8_STRRD|nr:pyridoxamine 5'-phosphate oxidase family protein [Streptosporangium roseum]ACZ83355.1 hypothetical protein Sros_0323 [Streptosporangium roseum DSM 43021]